MKLVWQSARAEEVTTAIERFSPVVADDTWVRFTTKEPDDRLPNRETPAKFRMLRIERYRLP